MKTKRSNKPFPVLNGPEVFTESWIRFENKGPDLVNIEIYGPIGEDYFSENSTSAKQFSDMMKDVAPGASIDLYVNSPGGNVHDGMAIHSQLKRHQGKVTAYVDGVAASIASVIIMAADTIEMPRNAMIMIHDPRTIAAGTSKDMRKIADALDRHAEAIVSVYESRTDLPRKKLSAMMAEETWMTGDVALSLGFCDRCTEEAAIAASLEKFDFSCFRNFPGSGKTDKHNRVGVDDDKPTNKMNLRKIVAILVLAGLEPKSDKPTDAELLSLVAKLPDDKDRKEITDWLNANPQTPAAPATPPAAPPAPAAQAPQPVHDTAPASMAAFTAELKEFREERAALRREREQATRREMENSIDRLIEENRVLPAERDRWVNRAIQDPTVLNDLAAREPQLPGGLPFGVEITASEPSDILANMTKLRAPVASMLRGNRVGAKVISANAMQMGRFINQNLDKLISFMNATTIDADLKRNVILSDVMRAFKRRMVNIGIFSNRMNSVPLQGTDEVTVPFYELHNTTSNDFVQGTGYEFNHDNNTGERTVTVDKRKYQPMNFSSDDFNRQPYFRPSNNFMMAAEQLGLDVWLDILSVITAANYTITAKDIAPASFDVDEVATLDQTATENDWPDTGRALVVGADYWTYLTQDNTLQHFLNSGSDQTLREGAVGRLHSFETFRSPRIPQNGEDLEGFICLPSAALVATSPIMPAPGVRQQLLNYDIVIDPDTGLAFEYRYWGNPDQDEDREVVECNYGYAKGNGNALVRITDSTSSGS